MSPPSSINPFIHPTILSSIFPPSHTSTYPSISSPFHPSIYPSIIPTFHSSFHPFHLRIDFRLISPMSWRMAIVINRASGYPIRLFSLPSIGDPLSAPSVDRGPRYSRVSERAIMRRILLRLGPVRTSVATL